MAPRRIHRSPRQGRDPLVQPGRGYQPLQAHPGGRGFPPACSHPQLHQHRRLAISTGARLLQARGQLPASGWFFSQAGMEPRLRSGSGTRGVQPRVVRSETSRAATARETGCSQLAALPPAAGRFLPPWALNKQQPLESRWPPRSSTNGITWAMTVSAGRLSVPGIAPDASGKKPMLDTERRQIGSSAGRLSRPPRESSLRRAHRFSGRGATVAARFPRTPDHGVPGCVCGLLHEAS